MKITSLPIPILLPVFLVLTAATSAQVSPAPTAGSTAPSSEWVHPDKNGRLAYKTTPAGDRIPDFSYAGYMGGGVALPSVPVKYTVHSSGKDDTQPIQSAIDAVAALPLTNGFRGAVELDQGVFTCSATIILSADGIVLRGKGAGNNGTTIRMTGSPHTAIVIGGNAPAADHSAGADQRTVGQPPANQPQTAAAGTTITDAYTPCGSRVFTVADATTFAAGDNIEIRRPVTDSWVHFMEMDDLRRDGKPQTWIGKSRMLVMQRKITAVDGNRITIDVPLTDALDAKFTTPPGVMVRKARPSQRITQTGVEDLHIQCPPLEIDYGHAPYSGIRIGGDDCWVKNVYFEETMNTTVLAGSRITMQQVVVTHTYPNLGASKPADFSFEGSQNLLDRCGSTGGNTYFVWTSSLIPGPNVVLNSTFRGHGSRIQPHQRWSTALLVDNCTIADGGIDFMNRGVAGSGHGWTMGWAVAWNCIAKTYIIQDPPGAFNWAIGCIGSRQQTARLFDSSPLLAEGIFESHGKPVTPQSLYLAQLADRLGRQALTNIGYAAGNERMFNNKSVKRSPPQSTDTDPRLGPDLALHRPVNTSNVRSNTKELIGSTTTVRATTRKLPGGHTIARAITREFGGEKAVDGNDKTYWATNDNAANATLEIDMEGPVTINTISIGEAAGLEHRIQEYKVEGQVDSDWKLLSQGTTIGTLKLDKFPAATVWKVRLTILKANSYPAIRKLSLYLSPQGN
jgi:hypothetical protein